MSTSMVSLRRKIGSATDLQSVVRTMKILAASSIGQYEQSVRALGDYHRTVELGLGVCFRDAGPPPPAPARSHAGRPRPVSAVVFGSDQGLVGSFNDAVTGAALAALDARSGPLRIWAVGERVHDRLLDAGIEPSGFFPVPGSVQAVASLVGRILVAIGVGGPGGQAGDFDLHLFHNRPDAAATYTPAHQHLLPLDGAWHRRQTAVAWPTSRPPEVLGDPLATVRSLVREYLFVSLFRACAESLASENASRLAAMERADKNIDELRANLGKTYHRLRQSGIDAELFDLISGFETLAGSATGT